MVKSVSVKKVKAPVKNMSRDMIGIRLDGPAGLDFRRMAKKEGYGPSTFARMIIEQYLTDHGRRKKRKRA